jgi:hypothetical protein
MGGWKSFRTIQVHPKDVAVLPRQAQLAVSWHAGSGGEPMSDVRRREFITLLCGWQQRGKA